MDMDVCGDAKVATYLLCCDAVCYLQAAFPQGGLELAQGLCLGQCQDCSWCGMSSSRCAC